MKSNAIIVENSLTYVVYYTKKNLSIYEKKKNSKEWLLK